MKFHSKSSISVFMCYFLFELLSLSCTIECCNSLETSYTFISSIENLVNICDWLTWSLPLPITPVSMLSHIVMHLCSVKGHRVFLRALVLVMLVLWFGTSRWSKIYFWSTMGPTFTLVPWNCCFAFRVLYFG